MDVAGVKVVSRDAQGPATKLAIVAKAGTRYQPAPGLTAGLEGFAFKVSTVGIGRQKREGTIRGSCLAPREGGREWTVVAGERRSRVATAAVGLVRHEC